MTALRQAASSNVREAWMLLDSRGVGGIETHVGVLSESLKSIGLAVRVVFLMDHGPHPLRDRLLAAGVPSECLAGGFRALASALWHRRPLLLHTHGYKAGILGRLAARVTGTPAISTFHAGETGGGRVRLYDLVDRWTSPFGEAVAVSHAIAACLPGRPSVIENFVPQRDTTPPGNRGGVAFVGRLSWEKGPDLFCKVAAEVPSVEYHVFGDGPMRRNLEEGMDYGIRWHGMVSDMAARWSEVSLLCMTSRNEGLPMAALEAMVHGVPVLAFSVGGLTTLIEDGRNGWLVPPLDVAAAAERVREWAMLPPSSRRAMGDAARETIKARYSPEAAIPRLLAVYADAGASVENCISK